MLERIEPVSQAKIYNDFSQFSELRATAKEDPDKALREIARQFESIFVKMMLQSMRDASFGDPNFDSNSSEQYRDMYDNQITLSMTEGKGIGLADVLVQQMKRTNPNADSRPDGEGEKVGNNTLNTNMRMQNLDTSIPVRAEAKIHDDKFTSNEDFVNRLMPHAELAAEELGVAPQVLIAQAALETGWGKKIIQGPNGTSSYNLFNIKADQRWDGAQVRVSSLEYENGTAKRQVSAFRSYDSIEQSFNDYVDFIKGNPRYKEALSVGSDPVQYTRHLQQAGYATDPDYANKVINIMQRETVGAPYSDQLYAAVDY